MRRNLPAVFFRTALTFSLTVLFAASLDAQVLGIPPAEEGNAWKDITSQMPKDEPLAVWVWNEAGALNPDGNPSDRWYADPGLQKSIGKFKEALATLAKENGPPTLGELAEDIGWKILSKSGSIIFESFDSEALSGTASAMFRLGEDEEKISVWLDSVMDEAGIAPETMGDDKVYSLPETPVPVLLGIHSGYLVSAVGDGQWKRTIARIDEKSETPDWLKKRLAALPVSRQSQFGFVSIQGILGLLPPEALEDPTFQRISEALSLESIKSFSASSGADSVSNVSLFHFECDKKGLASVMDVPAIEKSKLEELPADSFGAIAIRFSPETIMELIEDCVPEDQMEEAMFRFSEETGLDLKKDLVNHLDGTVRYYALGALISAKQVGVFKINDEVNFLESLDRINAALAAMADQQPLEFTESEKKGLKVFGLKSPGASMYWAVKDGELYISSNSRAIAAHIRKYTGGANKPTLLEGELATKILSESKSMGLEGPIGMQHYDFDPVIEIAFPLVQGAFAFVPAEVKDEFDFGVEDFPPIESLLGLRPSHSMFFKASGGYTGISRYDTPVPLELSAVAVSGIGVGMLLPAVQQVREAARRTQSLNNQRQLALALLNYESANMRFPPAFTTDEDGKPLLSWRVAILPFLDEKELYDEFHHDEPWDSEHNIALLERMPEVFRNPSAISRPGQTDYVAPFGEDSVLADGEGVKMGEITDGTSNTVLVMEVGMSQQVPWSAPQDIRIEELETLNMDNGHPGTFSFVLCDGSTYSFSKITSLDGFIDCCQKSDGVGMEELE